ncbi:hypothetical protein [Pigmentiphaga litoralis]|uniref:hypothetical protein n=1 Tax=Pigmentiphaga litoralis TaxID=516702 RepID=UPI003B42D129
MTGARYPKADAPATASVAAPRATAPSPAWRGAALPLALLAGWILAVDTGWLTNPLLVPLAQVVSAPSPIPMAARSGAPSAGACCAWWSACRSARALAWPWA